MFEMRHLLKYKVIVLCCGYTVLCSNIQAESDKEIQRINTLVDLVTSNLKQNGWNNIIIFGRFSNYFYKTFKTAAEEINNFTYVISNIDDDDNYVDDMVPYHSDSIVMNCYDFGNFEESLLNVMNLIYWHPHANIYLYYHTDETEENVARIFFIFWYYRANNVLLIQYDDVKETMFLSQFYPYVSETYDMERKYGCWTARKIGMPINTFDDSFICEKNCQNVSIDSKLRSTSFGTCIGISSTEISYNDRRLAHNLKIFEDKGKNFHGFRFRTYTTEILPFMYIKEGANKTFSLASRDGMIWNTMSNMLNFSFHFITTLAIIKEPFDFERNIQQIFAMAHRKADLFLIPIYQFDVVVVEIDYTFPYKDSGVCFAAHRAGYETILFDLSTLLRNYDVFVKFGISFVCIWFLFCIYTKQRPVKHHLDFIGKNFMNAVRSVLLINIYRQPRNTSFRIFLTVTIWSFFIINFATQAAIISFFTASKRGHEVDTFDDIADRGYRIEGMASPDVVLPDTEERFRKINSKLAPIKNIYDCVNVLSNDSHRFCLVDCSVGKYLERNLLNPHGEQYIHIAKDRVHSYYLNFVFPKYSVITDNFNKYMMLFFEAGLIKKWEEYRFNDIREDIPVKPLAMEDVRGIFNVYVFFVASTIIVFCVELIVGYCMRFKNNRRKQE